MRLTLDTNLVGHESVLRLARECGFDVCLVSVTSREVEGSSFTSSAAGISVIAETAVWDESRWGEGVWGDESSADCFESALHIISGGSFPAPGKRDSLTKGEHRQKRDAMIFCAHVRDGRDVFVTDDRKGFVDGNRRNALQERFATRIMTSHEFLANFDLGYLGGRKGP